MSSSVTLRPQRPQPWSSGSSNTAWSTDEGMTAEVDKATKVNLGIPSEHEPRTEADYDEVHGTEDYPPCLYPQYLPVWESPQAKYGPLEPFDYAERALAADSTFSELLPSGSKLRNLTATLGAEVSGVQLSALSDRGKDQLALLANEKKVLVFHNQDFPKLPIGQIVDYCRYFGRLFLHSHSGFPKGYPEIHIVHSRAGNKLSPEFFAMRTHSMAWHSDNSFDVQPPGVTFLYALEVPPEGGDTIFADMECAYERLSPAFRNLLDGLQAVHTSRDQAARAVAGGGYVRRKPVDTTHPVVRTNPRTGRKALFVNPQYTRRIVGLKTEESDVLLRFLFDHIANSQDLQCRVRWGNGTVVIFDNRNTCHSGITDWMDGRRRLIAR
ncbi:hypothetical protein E4U13_004061 [Claviceps humidiphila]|uniref:TauD/TfdA-like domain-containing protein n=1 Tax=Claviceps humidiphila TaxID=1294629 RepID=A0A9P7Q031_9HYPO|nr:hypothetical protein E4U13_004061 [Claviceps humidiphila]